MVSALIAIRTLGLLRVFIMGQPFRGRGLYLSILLYTVCLLIFGTVVQVIPADKTFYYLDVVDVCYCTNGLMAAIFALVWITWIPVVILSWRVRAIKSSFNEALEAAVGCIIVFSVLTTVTVMHYALPNFVLSLGQRIVTTCLDQVATHVYWWTIMGVPIFNCLFRRQQYLNEWTLKLLSDGLQSEYDVVTTSASADATLVERSSKGFSRTPAPNARYDYPYLGGSRYDIPITD
ncbi:hypothetical protein H4R21_004082, partial [Coemansia helicoidea]